MLYIYIWNIYPLCFENLKINVENIGRGNKLKVIIIEETVLININKKNWKANINISSKPLITLEMKIQQT